MNHPLPDMLGSSIAKIRELVDANTMIGDPIQTPDGVTILPVSKIRCAYAGGGSDFNGKNPAPGKDNPFGGGTGAGVSITPVAFLVIKGESVRLLPVAEPANNSMERLIEMLPDLIDQISGLIGKKSPDDAKPEA